MIIGDGIMLGAGGETASIVVAAPTGSTVTCTTPSGIVMTTAEIGGTWTFARLKSYGTYTITATDGTKTATSDVVVDSALEYVVEMDYKLWLYKDGDECSDVTGGYDEGKYAYSSSYSCKGTWTKNTDTLSASRPGYPYCYVQTFNNSFDVSNYSKMGIEGTYDGVTTSVSRDISDLTGNLYAMIIYLQNTTSTGWVAFGVASQKSEFSTGTTYRDVELLPRITGTVYVNKVWLE